MTPTNSSIELKNLDSEKVSEITKATKDELGKGTNTVDNSKRLNFIASKYKEAKEIKQSEKLQRKIERRERAKYKNKKCFVPLNKIRDEAELYFLQSAI